MILLVEVGVIVKAQMPYQLKLVYLPMAFLLIVAEVPPDLVAVVVQAVVAVALVKVEVVVVGATSLMSTTYSSICVYGINYLKKKV